MPKRNSYQSLADILENIERAQRYVGQSSLSAFQQDEQMIDAVLRRLQNASEASTRFRNEWPDLAAQFEARHPEVNRINFRNLGNRYRHDYDNIDVERVYEDLQTLIHQVQVAVTSELPFSGPPEDTEPR